MRGLLSFEGLPEGSLQERQVVDVKVSIFGVLPAQPYRMELIAFDPKNLTFTSNEVGMGVKHWQHRLCIVPHANGAELVDEIEIEAGWRTGMVAAWARIMYAGRHGPRVPMLADQSAYGVWGV